jgi:hypothetical protein
MEKATSMKWASLLVLVALLSCQGTDPPERRKAREIWQKNESLVEAAAYGRTLDLNGFNDACIFFERLTGIVVPVAAAGSFSRALTVADLGLKGSVTELVGNFSVSEGLATVRVDMLEGSIRNPFQIVDNLIQLATKAGASSLRIEGTLANEKLLEILAKRYGMQTQGGKDFIYILLQQAKKPPV